MKYINNKKYLLIIILCSILMLTFLGIYLTFNYSTKTAVSHTNIESYSLNMADCKYFIENKMISNEGGVYTNYMPTDILSQLATGHDILSESQGLLMEYYLLENNQNKFNSTYKFVTNKLMQNGVIGWRLGADGNLFATNSTIDDLRIIKALIEAQNKWNTNSYNKDIDMHINNFLNIFGQQLVNFYDPILKQKDTNINLCYIDLATLKEINRIQKNDLYVKSKKVLEGGYISNIFPLYFLQYNYANYKDENINLVESLISVLHIAEVGEVKEETISWLRNKIDTKCS